MRKRTFFSRVRRGHGEVVGNRHPIFLKIPYGEDRPPPFFCKLVTTGMDEGEWEYRNRQMRDLLFEQDAEIRSFLEAGNATKLLGLSIKAIATVLGNRYTRKPKEWNREQRFEDPSVQFCRRN